MATPGDHASGESPPGHRRAGKDGLRGAAGRIELQDLIGKGVDGERAVVEAPRIGGVEAVAKADRLDHGKERALVATNLVELLVRRSEGKRGRRHRRSSGDLERRGESDRDLS
jgi:hypothetical protein